METTKNNLPPNVKDFFYNLSEYLDTKMLYFGSVQRSDYVPGKSDIDVDIFTDNENSVIAKMQHFLGVSKKEFKSIVWVIDYENQPPRILISRYLVNLTASTCMDLGILSEEGCVSEKGVHANQDLSSVLALNGPSEPSTPSE